MAVGRLARLNEAVMTSMVHPTKQALIDTTVGYLNEVGPTAFTVEDVLGTSGISKGSMYHHFEDFDDLIESAQVARFAAFVDRDIEVLNKVLTGASSRAEFVSRLKVASVQVQSPDRIGRRLARAQIAGWEGSTPKFRTALAAEQQRLTDTIADLVRDAQSRGFVNPVHAPEALAVFIQAYSLGRVLDDIAEKHLEPAAWNSLVEMFIDRIIVPE